MNVHRTLGVLALAVCLAASVLHAEEAKAAKDPAPKLATLEEQVAFLENALSDALATRDWKQTELCAKGFKTAGLKDLALETSILRAERDVAWGVTSVLGSLNRVQCEAWGLAARYLAGNPAGIATLRTYATAEIPGMTAIAPDEYKRLFQNLLK